MNYAEHGNLGSFLRT